MRTGDAWLMASLCADASRGAGDACPGENSSKMSKSTGDEWPAEKATIEDASKSAGDAWAASSLSNFCCCCWMTLVMKTT
eukprot:10065620-Karenia_brevis.AAC.1